MPETATLETPTTPAELKCRFCSRSFTTKPGLTNHAKVCQSNPDRANTPAKVPEVHTPKPESKVPSYGQAMPANGEAKRAKERGIDWDEQPDRSYPERSERSERPERSERSERPQKPENGQPFSIADRAFIMFPDHICMMLDLNFCIALADFILEKGSPNKAITAFGHQLKRLDE